MLLGTSSNSINAAPFQSRGFQSSLLSREEVAPRTEAKPPDGGGRGMRGEGGYSPLNLCFRSSHPPPPHAHTYTGAWSHPASTGRWRTRRCGMKPGEWDQMFARAHHQSAHFRAVQAAYQAEQEDPSLLKHTQDVRGQVWHGERSHLGSLAGE
eukprot:1157585-Pelagomonas_calceolata.AAC.3